MQSTTSGARISWPMKAARVRPRDRRNSFAIHGYTGFNGGGKTMAAVYDSLPTLAAGRPVVSTCRILDPRTGEPHPLWVPLDDFRLLLDLSYCDVILDEVTGIASSRDSAGLPSAVLNRLMQLRKGDVTVRWTTPNWRRADTGLREITQGLTTCRGFAPVECSDESDDGLIRRWKQRRGFLWMTYDAKNFEEWSASKEKSPTKQHRIKPVTRQLLWGPGAPVLDCYDTYEVALTLGVVSEAGLCMDCGGRRMAKKCACAGEVIRDASAGMLRWAEVDAARRKTPAGRHLGQYLPTELVAGVADVHNGSLVEFPETDDTPGVVLDLASQR